MNYYLLVDKDDRPMMAESNPTFCTVESKVILELADKARPENAPHRWQELVPKEKPVGYVVLDKDQELFGFYKKKSTADFNAEVGNECPDNQFGPYTVHEVMP